MTISGLYDRILLSIIFVDTSKFCSHDCYIFAYRYCSRKVASKKVADNIASQFNLPVEVSYKLTLIKFFVA